MFIQPDKNIYGENDSAFKINIKANGASCDVETDEKHT